MRDNQRQKVYDSERAIEAWDKERIEDIHALTKYVNKITRSAWYRRRFTRWATIRVLDGRGRRAACGSSQSGYIKMPVWARTKLVTLHELSHVVQPYASAWHGREFCKIYLAFVKKWMGKEVYEALKQSFKDHNVKYVTGKVKV